MKLAGSEIAHALANSDNDALVIELCRELIADRTRSLGLKVEFADRVKGLKTRAKPAKDIPTQGTLAALREAMTALDVAVNLLEKDKKKPKREIDKLAAALAHEFNLETDGS